MSRLLHIDDPAIHGIARPAIRAVPDAGREGAKDAAKPAGKSAKPPVKHIALAFPTGLAHLHLVVQGIAEYARRHARWVFTTNPEASMPVQSLRGWQGAGVIAELVNRGDVQAAKGLKMPVVTFSGALREAGVPRVRGDNELIGRLAAEHLLDCGFRRFMFYGLRNVAYSQDRGRGFAEPLEKAGFSCDDYLSPNAFSPRRPWQDEMEKLDAWIGSIEPPVGLFAVNDQRARMAVDACRRCGWRVPEDVAVLGVDNDQVACEFSDPPLSSIACDWYQVGFESARLLDRLMRGEPAPKEDLLIPPDAVVRRRSTDVKIIDHEGVARAVAYVREHVRENFGVEALIREAGITRRNLELSFKKALGCTPHQYICQARVERAKELLLQPKRMKLSDIADACGFHDLRRLRLVFHRLEGRTPAEFRQQHGRRRRKEAVAQ